MTPSSPGRWMGHPGRGVTLRGAVYLQLGGLSPRPAAGAPPTVNRGSGIQCPLQQGPWAWVWSPSAADRAGWSGVSRPLAVGSRLGILG